MGCRNEGMEYSFGREWFGGSYSLIFLPAPPSREEEGFLSLLALMGSVMAWCMMGNSHLKVSYIVMRA